MNKWGKMLISASGALQHLFNLSVNDSVLILTDSDSALVAEAFENVIVEKGCSLSIYKIKNDKRPLRKIPAELVNLLKEKTIVLNIIKAYSEEISFRIKWIFKVEENKRIKMGHMPGITEEMMLNSVNVDFIGMKAAADKLINKLENAKELNITTDEGTEVILGVAGRKFIDDIGVTPGKMCNIPCGEIYCAPLETEANGVIVFNASIGDIGILKKPLKAYLERGRITKFGSSDNRLVRRITELTNVDDDARVIGELGIGINPGAHITGNMLEDEKALGTAHIAFGNNADFEGGGKNYSKIHRDYLFYRPTIEVRNDEAGRKLIMRQGEFVF